MEDKGICTVLSMEVYNSRKNCQNAVNLENFGTAIPREILLKSQRNSEQAEI